MEAARKQGLQEGQAQANMAAAQALEQERSAVIAAVREFGQQRREYFRRVEIETARLALAIARKVLNREAQMDPLLLAGVVRVALDQMQAGTRLVLRTSPGSAPGWAKFCVQQMAGEQHEPGGCSRQQSGKPSLYPGGGDGQHRNLAGCSAA